MYDPASPSGTSSESGRLPTSLPPGHVTRAEVLTPVLNRREALLDALLQAAAAGRFGRSGKRRAARASMTWVFDTFNACAVEARGLRWEEIAWFEARGAVRQAQGTPLSEVIGGFRDAFDHSYDSLLTALALESPRAGSVVALGEVSRTLYDVRDQVLAALEAGYRAAERNESDAVTMGAATALRRLLDGEADETTMLDSFRELGHAPGGATLLVAVATDSNAALSAALADLFRGLPGAIAGIVQPTPVAHVVVLLADGPIEAPRLRGLAHALADRHGMAVYSIAGPDLTRVGGLYSRLRPHISMIDRLSDAWVVSPSEVSMWHLQSLLPAEEVVRFVREVAGPLIALPPAESEAWRRTLDAVCQTGGNISAAADLIPCSRRTVGRHLDDVANLIEVDARQPRPRTRLGLTLNLLLVHADDVPPLGDATWVAPSLRN